MSEKQDCSCHEAYDEHQEENECRLCGRCIWAEPAITGKNDDYEDQGICLDCAMNKEGVTLEELAAIFR